MNHQRRIERLRTRLTEDALQQMVISNLLNVRWLTGFTGSSGVVMVKPDTITLLTDSRYTTQAEEQVGSTVDVVVTGSADGERSNDHIAELAASAPRLAIEADHLTVAARNALATAISDSTIAVDFVETEGIVADLRRTKDDAEIDALRAASRIADDSLMAVRPWSLRGHTERSVARLLEWEMAERGSERVSFETILASGPNGAKPHARPSSRVLEDGDLVVIDFGATVNGYGSDMTRTFVVGGKPTAEQSRWYRNVLDAQQAGIETTTVGAPLSGIHETTVGHLRRSGQDGVYQHGTGHGVGLFIHENPILSPRSEGLVESSMALTVEPGAYVPEVGGIRIEDLILTGPDGPETLTRFPKGLAPEE
ncbi:MAG: Xaa-Pro peptidase family protein [Acidimicrobiia bacterium]|nr:Xaa-Pro peptidase family protein [Acidimicrobiia bacterium]